MYLENLMLQQKIKNLVAAVIFTSICISPIYSHAADKQQKIRQEKSASQGAKQGKTEMTEAVLEIYEQAVDAYNTKDYSKAIELLTPLAEKGYARAQGTLGIVYHIGGTGERSIIEALSWYEKAYQNGYFEIASNLGALYRKGYAGVTRDARKAEQVLKKAGEDKFAYYNLALLYPESPELINENNLLTALQYAKGAEQLGNEYMKEIISTIECALNPNARRKTGWFNAQGLEAYELSGPVMTVRYSDGYRAGFLVFGKSGNLIAARDQNWQTLYRYDNSCNLVKETRIATDSGKVLQELTYQYINDRLDYTRFSNGSINGSIRYVYSTQPDGSVFVTEDYVRKYARGDSSEIKSKHYDRSGRLIWSDPNGYLPFGQFDHFTHESVQSSGLFYSSTITKDYNGRITYDKGSSYAYTPDGLLFRVTDRAGSVGQTRGVITFERYPNNLLKREIYSDTSSDEFGGQKNVMSETTYDNYKADGNRNWSSRIQTYQFEGKPQSINQSRTITYW